MASLAEVEEKILRSDDAAEVLEALVEAQNKARHIGLKLGVPQYIIDSILKEHSNSLDQLDHVVVNFLEQAEPRPTWRAIVNALRSPLVELPRLANKIETKFCPPAPTQSGKATPPSAVVSLPQLPTNIPAVISQSAPPTAVSQSAPPTAVSQSATPTAVSQSATPTAVSQSGDLFPAVALSVVATPPGLTSLDTDPRQREDTVLSVQPPIPEEASLSTQSLQESLPDPSSDRPLSVTYVQAKVRRFEKRFNDIWKDTRNVLQSHHVSIKAVADALLSLPTDDMDEHKVFLESHIANLYHASDHSELFGILSCYWNYLSYQLLEYLIAEFSLEAVKGQMEIYKQDLQQFRMHIPLKLFCQSQRRRQVDPPPGFRKAVVEHHWPDTVTLEVVESFRQEYVCQYNLHKCAMMLANLEIGSFIITWFVPESIIERLSVKGAGNFFEKHSIRKLKIAGNCVYKTTDYHSVPSLPPSASASTRATVKHVYRKSGYLGQQRLITGVVTGQLGTGKTTLINNLFSKDVTAPGHAKMRAAVEDLKSGTKEVKNLMFDGDKINFRIFDTPGWNDTTPTKDAQIIEDICKKTEGKVDFLYYCVSARSDVVSSDWKVFKLLTSTFTKTIWNHTIFVITFCNNSTKPPKDFGEKMVSYKKDIRKALSNCGIPYDETKDILVVPAGDANPCIWQQAGQQPNWMKYLREVTWERIDPTGALLERRQHVTCTIL